MEKKYTLAEVNILIKTDFDFTDVERYAAFTSDFETPDLTYEFTTVETLPPLPEKPLYTDGGIVVSRSDGVTYRFYMHSRNSAYALLTDERIESGIITVRISESELRYFRTEMRVFDTIAIEHAMALYHGTLLHSSFISYNGEAILFTAPSQTGKSTQAELWRMHKGAQVINGDRSLIKLKDGVLHAYSLPYCGTSGICENYHAPIKTVVVLRQAPFNRITRMRPAAAFRDIYEGCAANIWYERDMTAICDLVENIITTVPVYLLECLPDEDAVNTLFNVLNY